MSPPTSSNSNAATAAQAAVATATAERVEQGLERVEQGIRDVLHELHTQAQAIGVLTTQTATLATRLVHIEQTLTQAQTRLGALEQNSLPHRLTTLESEAKAQAAKVDELLKAHPEARWIRTVAALGLGGFATYFIDRLVTLLAKAP